MAQLNQLFRTGVRAYSREAVDLGKQPIPPTIRTRMPDGEVRVERIPAALHIKMVHPAGHVVRCVLSGGMGKHEANDPQILQNMQELPELGFIPYGMCPKRLGMHEHLPQSARAGEACTVAVDGKTPISVNACCKCVAATIEYRRTVAAKETNKTEQRYKSNAAQERDALARQLEVTTRILDAQNPTAKKSKRKQELEPDGE